MYLNDHVTNVIEKKSTNPYGCLGCDSGSCNSCPFKKSGLGDLGQNYGSIASTGASIAGSFIPIPGAGPILGGVTSIFSSLFGGGPTKEQKQSGEYYQAALKSAAAHAYYPQTPQEIIEFMQYMVSPSTDPKTDYPVVCGTKWCSMKAPCSGASARGCRFLLPYTVYKSIGGPYSTANPAYDTFGGGRAMLLGQIIPYFKKMLDQYNASLASGAGATVEGAAQTAMNYWPLLLLGGLVYLGSGRRSA